jgi:tRNA G46 methylase TrmB
MEHVFTDIYQNKLWGDNREKGYLGSSGPGSRLEFNIPYIQFVKKFINDNMIQTIVDIGCGDFKCMNEVLKNSNADKYTGIDIYKELIDSHNLTYNTTNTELQFIHMDVTKSNPPPADLCIIKDVFQHWPFFEIEGFLRRVTQNKLYEYILITNDQSGVFDFDTHVGGYHPLKAISYPLYLFKAQKVFEYPHREVCLIKKETQ